MSPGRPNEDVLPVVRPGSVPAAPTDEPPPPKRPGVLRRLVRPRFSLAGATLALLFFWLSLTPSLLPRSPLFSGVVGGISAMTGYAVGAALGALTRRLLRERPLPVAGRRAWLVLAAVMVLGTPLVLWQSARWQEGLRTLIGLEPDSPAGPVAIVLVAAVVSAVILLVARLVGVFGGWTVRQVGRLLPPRAAVAVGALLTVVVLVGLVQGFLWRGFVAAMDRVASVADGTTDKGATRPGPDSLRSGSDASLVTWDSLGRMGRRFVGLGPTPEQLRRFGPPGCCKTPIRVYVGLDDGDSAQERAAIAVRELDRTGALRRKVLAVYTATGTGWVNPRAADGLEYLYGGDTAQLSIQYSHLPSWLSFLVDQTRAAEAGNALIGAVRERLAQIPPAQRPRLVLYGESLGSYGTEKAFRDVSDLQSATDGALLVGPTFSNPIWRRLTDTRTPGSPEWLPVTTAPGVRFARSPADLTGMPASPPAHLVYLQNSSDPITWWSRRLALRRPDWTRPPPPPDRAPGFRWWPLVTFWQTGADLVDSLGVPTGYGHNFGSNVVDGWVALHRPAGWSDADTARLKTLVYQSR
jgi:uncharacterized membrane protein